MIHSYADCVRLAETPGWKRYKSKKLANRTYLIRVDDDTFGVKYHKTIVVKIRKDGLYGLYTGGWKTVSTKDRLNRFSPARIYQKDWEWFHMGYDGIPFSEGDVVDVNGQLQDWEGVDPDERQEEVEKNKKLKADIDKYVDNYIEAFRNGEGKSPGPGDCYYCRWTLAGHYFKEPEHIIMHIEEDYFVPSLIVAAMREFGASQVAQAVVHSWMNPDSSTDNVQSYYNVVGPQIRQALRRFLYRQVGLAS